MAALPQHDLSLPVGTVKTFGSFGPQYEVVGAAGVSAKGDPLISVRVVRTGETLEYELESALADPEAP